MLIKRGDIFYADLNPVVGSEQGGVRPVLIVQNDIGNKYSPTFVVVPLSSAKKQCLPTHIHICGTKTLPRDSIVLAEQIRTIDKSRLREYVGTVDSELMKKIDTALKISIGVDENG
jgi:mRNA interferase MazF